MAVLFKYLSCFSQFTDKFLGKFNGFSLKIIGVIFYFTKVFKFFLFSSYLRGYPKGPMVTYRYTNSRLFLLNFS
jgi:hypothetical protein